MNFLELAKKRCSIRKYQQKKVEKDKVLKILEAGRVAPTGVNAQPQRLIVVEQKEGLDKISKGANIFGAPFAIIVCANHDVVWKRKFDNKDISDIDVSIVTDHMMLEATELGLGTVWICNFNPDVIKTEFNIPDNIEPINILAIGYTDGEVKSPDRHDTLRKPLSETVVYETF